MILNSIKNFINDEAGVTAIEYGLIAALIAVGVSVTAGQLGTDVGKLFTNISGKITAAIK